MYPAANMIVSASYSSFDKDKKKTIIQTFPNSKGVTCITQSLTKRYYAWAQQLQQNAVITILDLQKSSKKRLLVGKIEFKKYTFLNFNGSETVQPKSLVALATVNTQTYVVHFSNCLTDKYKCQASKIQDKQGKQSKDKYYSIFFFNKQEDFVVVNGKGSVKTYKLSNQGPPKSKDTPFVRKDIQESSYNFLSFAIVKNQLILGTQGGQLFHISSNCEFKSILQSSPCFTQPIETLPSIQVLISFSKGFLVGSTDGRIFVYQKLQGKKQFAKETRRFHVKDAKVKVSNLVLTPKQENLLVGMQNNQIFKIPFADKSYDDMERYEYAIQNFHSDTITGLDTCLRKSLVASCSIDKTIRIWNTQNNSFNLQIWTPFSQEKALGVTFHPSGMHLIVSFSDKIRLFNIFENDLISFKEIAQKNCPDIKFSNGGQYFGILSNSAVWIYKFFTGEQIYSKNTQYQNQCLVWEQDDQGIFIGTTQGVINYIRLQEPIFELQIFKQNKIHIKTIMSIFSNIVDKQNVYYQRVIFIGGLFSNNCPPQEKGIYKIIMTPKQQKDKERMEFTRDASRYIISKPEFISTMKNVSKIGMLHSGKLMIYCTCDKNSPYSIRLCKYPFNGIVHQIQSHLLPIRNLAINFDDNFIYTGGEDGTIVTYEIKAHELKVKLEQYDFTDEFLIAKNKYLEKKKSLDDLKKRNEEKKEKRDKQIRSKTLANAQQIERLDLLIKNREEEYQANKQKLEKELFKMQEDHKYKLQSLKQKHQKKKETVSKDYEEKIRLQNERLEQLKKKKELNNRTHNQEMSKKQAEFEQMKEKKQREYKERLKKEVKKVEELQTIYQKMEETQEIQQKQSEEKAEKQIEEKNEVYQEQKRQLKEQNIAAQTQNQMKKQEFDKEKQKLQQQKLQMNQIKEDIKKTQQRHEELIQTKQSHAKQIEEREKTIKDKMTRIHQLKKKTQELQKFKFVLDYKIKELTRNVGPKEEEITKMNEQIDNMESQIEHFKKTNKNMNLIVKDLRLKKAGMQQELEKQNKMEADNLQYIKNFEYDLSQFYPKSPFLNNQKQLKKKMIDLYRKYVESEQVIKKKGDAVDKQQQFFKQRAHLETTVKGLKQKFDKNFQVHFKDNKRMISQNEELIFQLNDLKRQKRNLKEEAQRILNEQKLIEELPRIQKEIIQKENMLSQLKTELQRKQQQYHNQGSIQA